MTDDLRTRLDRASDTMPLKAFDIDPVVIRGRARSRRRAFGRWGGGALGVAAATAAILTVTSLLSPGAGPDAAPPPAGAAPGGYALPDLDPATAYGWQSRNRVDDAIGTQLTGVLAGWFATNLPAAKVVRYGPGFEPDGVTYQIRTLPLAGPESPFLVSRYTNRLVPRTPGNAAAVYEEPVYRLATSALPASDQDGDPTFDSLAGLELAIDGTGQQQLDLLRFALVPAGGYRAGFDPAQDGARGPANGFLVEGCATYDVTDAHPGTGDDRRFSFECSEVTGSGGERVLRVAQHETYLDASISYTINTVVVYRVDGTAVVLSTTAQPGFAWTQGSGSAPTTPGSAWTRWPASPWPCRSSRSPETSDAPPTVHRGRSARSSGKV